MACRSGPQRCAVLRFGIQLVYRGFRAAAWVYRGYHKINYTYTYVCVCIYISLSFSLSLSIHVYIYMHIHRLYKVIGLGVIGLGVPSTSRSRGRGTNTQIDRKDPRNTGFGPPLSWDLKTNMWTFPETPANTGPWKKYLWVEIRVRLPT